MQQLQIVHSILKVVLYRLYTAGFNISNIEMILWSRFTALVCNVDPLEKETLYMHVFKN